MSDIQRLIDNTFPFVEELLVTYHEFYPLASAVKEDGSIAQVGIYKGDEHPPSDKVIADLKNAFITSQKDYKCIAIFYDVKITDPASQAKKDAIAVFTESKNDTAAFVIYYPYELTTGNEFRLTEPAWKEINNKEIFG